MWPADPPAVEVHPALDVRRLARAGVLGSGGAWRVPLASAGWLTVRDAGDALLVAFRVNAGDGWQPTTTRRVSLGSTPQPFGGARAWFLCPACGRRCALLHVARGDLACRLCHGLRHASLAEPAAWRALRKALKLDARLGGDGDFELPPLRPKGMHRRTFEAASARLETLAAAADAAAGRRFGGMHLQRLIGPAT